MGGRISALKKRIAILKMTPTNQYLASLNYKIDDLTDKLAVANEEIEHRFSSDYVKTLDNYILSLKKEVAGKQITIDALEFDMDRTEKRLISADEIIIKSGKEIELLKQKEHCNREDMAALIDKLYITDRGLKEANVTIAKYAKEDDKKIKNRLKKLLIG